MGPLQSFDLFPSRIWQAHLPAPMPQLEGWTKTVLAMRASSPKPAGRTVRQGWNSEDMAVLARPEFAALNQAIRAACAGALSEMGLQKLAFSLQSWINLHDRGGFYFLDMHERLPLSGSCSSSVPRRSGHFVFLASRPGAVS